MAKRSDLEVLMEQQMRDAGFPAFETEHRFAKDIGRQWRFDFAWPGYKVALEVDGGTFLPKGYHTRGTGFEKDVEKHNVAAMTGWLVIRVTKHMINDLRALNTIRAALLIRGAM